MAKYQYTTRIGSMVDLELDEWINTYGDTGWRLVEIVPPPLTWRSFWNGSSRLLYFVFERVVE